MTAAKRGASTFCAMACAGALALLPLLLATPEAIAEPVGKGDTIEGTGNARYCELIPVVREGSISLRPFTTRSGSTIVRPRFDAHHAAKWMASQTVGGSLSVQVTRWRRCAGRSTQSPGRSSRACASAAMRRRAAPATSSANSSSSWSYHSSSGVACPVETIRSMRSPGRRQSDSVSSAASGPAGRPRPRFPAFTSPFGAFNRV